MGKGLQAQFWDMEKDSERRYFSAQVLSQKGSAQQEDTVFAALIQTTSSPHCQTVKFVCASLLHRIVRWNFQSNSEHCVGMEILVSAKQQHGAIRASRLYWICDCFSRSPGLRNKMITWEEFVIK